MTRPRSLRTAFSNTSACWPMLSGVMSLEADAAGLRAVVVAAGAVLLDRWPAARLARAGSLSWQPSTRRRCRQ